MRLLPLLLLVVACSGEERRFDLQPPPPPDGSGWEAIDTDRAAALQAKLEEAVTDLGLVGAAIAVADRKTGQLWEGTSGLSDRATNETWAPGRTIRIGSVTKTFTAAGIYLLIEDGVVSLDDPLERWVPGYYDGLQVTLRHLITNTSGIVSYNYAGSFDDTRPWMPRELVDWAVANEPTLRFTPGSKWEYSNTNYVLLGLVIEAASGKSYEAFLEERMLRPLKLENTYLAGSQDTNPNLVRSYDQSGDEVEIDPSFGWAAGSIASTPSDLARWGAALFAGDVISEASLTTMLTPVVAQDAVDYGHGAFVEIDGDEGLYGHTGGIGGFLTYMYFYKTEDVTLVAVSNKLGVNLRHLSAYGWSVMLGFEYP